MAIKILNNLACSPSVQRLLREGSMHLLQDIACATPPRSVWFPPHPSPEDLVEMRRIMTQVCQPTSPSPDHVFSEQIRACHLRFRVLL